MTNRPIESVTKLNHFLRLRGPDFTSNVQLNGFSFIHNLLSLTGSFTIQPIIDPTREIACLLNGEIYNYRTFGEHPSDACSLLSAYEKHGVNFPKFLDGEFALVLVDFKNDLIVIATDAFGTKPLWFSLEDKKHIGISSYSSGLRRAGFKHPRKVEANRILVYRLGSFEKLTETSCVDFNLDQYKDSYEDWIRAFKDAVRKRAYHSDGKKIFMGLSSGYDSGALACELTSLEVDFKAFTILASEDEGVITDRHRRLGNGAIKRLTRSEFHRLKARIQKDCENYDQVKSDGGIYRVRRDHASMGLACVCESAAIEDRRIYFSGQGPDEIISDYGHNGRRFCNLSEFGGWFPNDLKEIFPWRNFYQGSQQMYLAKEECITGMFGIEGRYPFLDKYLVQEFLNLSPSLKNERYKAPIAEFLSRNNYPFQKDTKIGFLAGRNLDPN